MKLEQMALVAAALAVVFWPQLQAYAQTFRHAVVPRMAPPSGGRAAWVATVLALQDELAAAGRDKAATLAGQLVVEIVAGHPATPVEVRK